MTQPMDAAAFFTKSDQPSFNVRANCSSCSDLSSEELGCRTRCISKVQEMGRLDVQSPFAHLIAVIAEDLELFGWKAVNPSLVLLVLRVSKQNYAFNLFLNSSVERRDGS
jgi:hypothetical protein